MKYYEIPARFAELDAAMSEAAEENQGVVPDFLEDHLSDLRAHLSDAVAWMVRRVRNAEGESEALAKEIKRLQARKKSADNQRERFRDMMMRLLISTREDGKETKVTHRDLIATITVTNTARPRIKVEPEDLPFDLTDVKITAKVNEAKKIWASAEEGTPESEWFEKHSEPSITIRSA